MGVAKPCVRVITNTFFSEWIGSYICCTIPLLPCCVFYMREEIVGRETEQLM